jgi:hypothetical protein
VGDSSGILVPVTATSSLGGSTTVQAFAATLDNSSPPVPLLAPLPVTAITPDLLVSGTAHESDGAAADSVSVRVNGAHRAGIRPDGSGAFSVGVTLSERSNAITAVALDRAGNPSPATPAQTVAFVPDFFIEVPKRFHPGDAFTIGSPSADMSAEVRIVNLAGQLITTLKGGGSELLTLIWEGRNADEEAVNAGPYIARIAVDIPGQPRRLEHRALILVSR